MEADRDNYLPFSRIIPRRKKRTSIDSVNSSVDRHIVYAQKKQGPGVKLGFHQQHVPAKETRTWC